MIDKNEYELMFTTIQFEVECNIEKEELKEVLEDYYDYPEMYEIEESFCGFRVTVCIINIDTIKKEVYELFDLINEKIKDK